MKFYRGLWHYQGHTYSTVRAALDAVRAALDAVRAALGCGA